MSTIMPASPAQPSQSSMRDCCNVTMQTIYHGFEKFGALIKETVLKIVEMIKPHLQKLGAFLALAGAAAWAKTTAFFIDNKKELGFIGIGIAATVATVLLIKGALSCCAEKEAEPKKTGGSGSSSESGSDVNSDNETESVHGESSEDASVHESDVEESDSAESKAIARREAEEHRARLEELTSGNRFRREHQAPLPFGNFGASPTSLDATVARNGRKSESASDSRDVWDATSGSLVDFSGTGAADSLLLFGDDEGRGGGIDESFTHAFGGDEKKHEPMAPAAPSSTLTADKTVIETLDSE